MRPLVRAYLLGGFRVEVDDEVVQLSGSRTARSLLAYLLLSPDRRHLRPKLAGMYWPDQPESVARERLRSALWRIGKGLEPTGIVVIEQAREWVGIDASIDVWVDVAEFRRLAADRDPEADGALEEAAALFQGEFMPGHYEDWVVEEQESMRSTYLTVLDQLQSIREADGKFDQALLVARQIVAADHLNEGAHRDVMRLNALLRRPEEALRQYRDLRRLLKYELGAEPAPGTARLAADIASHVESQRSVAPTADRSQAPVFVSREAERDTLMGLLEGGLGGAGAIALVEGPPGVGKSTLLEQAGEDARWRNYEIISGSYQDRVGGAAFEGIRGAIGMALTPLRIEQLRSKCDPMWLAEASRVIPQLSMGGEPPIALAGEDGRWKLQESLVQVLRSLASIYPTMLVLEDVHWADLDSLAVVRQLAGSLPEVPMVALLSYRREEAESDRDRWGMLQDLDRLAITERVVLGDLDVPSIAKLVSAIGGFGEDSHRLAELLVAQTGGNPLFVIETLKSLREDDPSQAFVLPSTLPVASSVAGVVERRLAKVGDVARQVIDAAAVFARPISVSQLAELTDLDFEGVLDAVTEVVRRQILSDQADGLLFGHELIRRVAYDGIHPDRMLLLHIRTAELLEEIEGPAAEIAHHLHEAGQWEGAVEWSVAAARAAESLAAYATARTHYDLALSAAEDANLADDVLFDAIARAEGVLDVLGDRRNQRSLIDRMDELAATPSQRADVALRLAWFLAHTDQFELAEAAAVSGRSLVGDWDAEFSHVLAQIQLWSGRPDEAAQTLERLREQSGVIAGKSHMLLGTAYVESGRYADSERELRQAIEGFQAAGDRAGEARANGILGTVIAEQGKLAEAQVALRFGQTIAQEIGYRVAEAECTVNLATIAFKVNDPTDARELFERAEAAFESIGQQRGVASVRANLASLALNVLGDIELSRRLASQAYEYFGSVGDIPRQMLAQSLLADVARFENPKRFRELFEQSAEVLLATDARYLTKGVIESYLSSLLEADDSESASRWFAELERLDMPDRDAPGILVLQAWHEDSPSGRADLLLDKALDQLSGDVQYAVAIAWRAYLVSRRTGALSHRALELAYSLLAEVLVPLSAEAATTAAKFPRHRAIIDEWNGRSKRTVSMRLPRSGTPGGRSPSLDEMADVMCTISDPSDLNIASTIERRQAVLLRVLAEIHDQGGVAGVKHLSAALGVSQATVKRDLAVLRAAGNDVKTKGSSYRSGPLGS